MTRSIADVLVSVLSAVVLNRTVRSALGDKLLSKNAMKQYVGDVKSIYRSLSAELPNEPNRGAAVMVRLAAKTVAIYKALRKYGFTHEDAKKTTAEITWLIYIKLSQVFWMPTRILSERKISRVKKAMDFFMKVFPYRAPGYQMEYVEVRQNVVAFNVYRCPAADYFCSQGLSDLCVSSFCNLDFPLAETWGVTLDRHGTIAGGSDYCDFCFRERT